MFIQNILVLEQLADKHASSRKHIKNWLDKIQSSDWGSFINVRETFNSADYKKPFVIFNIGGNKCRLQTEVNYLNKTVTIIRIGTHSDYNKWNL